MKGTAAVAITEREIDQAFSDHRATLGGVREDYFGLLYLQSEFGLAHDQAALQNAFGGHDYGIDAFHIDVERRNLYLVQFKWSPSPGSFKGSYERLIGSGMEHIFGDPLQDKLTNPLLSQLKSRLMNDMALVDRVMIYFVFNGDVEEAERSSTLETLREDLEAKKYLIDQFFERPMSLVIEYRSAKSGRAGGSAHKRKSYRYMVKMPKMLLREGPNGVQMHLGFIRVTDLHRIFLDMRQRFFERNIRSGLSESEAPNRAIKQTLKDILIDCKVEPSVFAFNHNGVTIHAQKFAESNGEWEIAEPRLLNGAQTVTTFSRFMELNTGNQQLAENQARLDELYVPCRIITEASQEFVVGVTINNNRQNPVMPWNLRANDLIQCQFFDKFRDDLGIYYERQQNMFSTMTDSDLEEMEIDQSHKRAVEILKLTKTFLASDGLVDKMSNMTEAFENEKIYSQIFDEKRLTVDSRRILLCYKVQLKIHRMAKSIQEKGEAKYGFINRARNLLWALLVQAILNDKDLEWYCDQYGNRLVVEANYIEWLIKLSTTRARLLIGDVVKMEPYATHVREENYGFLRTQAVFKKCMESAHNRWGWVQCRLR